MRTLSPCPACQRHVRVTEEACPFCGAAIPRAAARGTEAVARLRGRPSRAAIFAAGATLAGLSACSSSTPGGDAGVSGAAGMSAGGQGGDAGGAAGAGGRDGGSNDAVSTFDGPIAIYSAAFPPPIGQGSK